MLKNIYKFKDNNNNNLLHILLNDSKYNTNSNYLNKVLEKGQKYGYLKYIINKRNNEGDTPLHLAVKVKNYTAATSLLKYGAKANLVDANSKKIIGGGKIYSNTRYL